MTSQAERSQQDLAGALKRALQRVADLEVYNGRLEAAVVAYQYYIDVHDNDLIAREWTRGDALLAARVAEEAAWACRDALAEADPATPHPSQTETTAVLSQQMARGRSPCRVHWVHGERIVTSTATVDLDTGVLHDVSPPEATGWVEATWITLEASPETDGFELGYHEDEGAETLWVENLARLRRAGTVRGATETLFLRYSRIIAQALDSGVPIQPLPDKTGLDNLSWMCRTALAGIDTYPVDKLSRWLGFIQGVLAMRGLVTVDGERDASRGLFHSAYRADGTPVPPTRAMTDQSTDQSTGRNA